MAYQLLSIYKYNGVGPSRTSEEVEQEYQRRIHGYSTIVTNLFPVLDHGEFDQQSVYPLFFVQTNDINLLLNQVLRNSKEIITLSERLPGVAKDSYTRRLLTEEIYHTNEIEGVKTNRKEIGTVVSEINIKNPPARRLASTVKLYNRTLSGRAYQIKYLDDFRKIYDELLKGEINQKRLPDGKLFRNKSVYIGNASQKVHMPPANEREIQEKLIPLIDFMNSHSVLDVIKSLVTHFMFENIHPFTDGNGRTGRYLLSSYLASKLDPYTGLSISGAIHANQSAYYKVFKQTDDFQNRADATIFINKMLEIIAQGQNEVVENLSRLSDDLQRALGIIEKRFADEIDRTIVYIFAQSKLFSDNVETGIQDNQLRDFLYEDDPKTYHKRDLKRRIEKLENDKVLIRVKSKPMQHVISDEYI